MRTRIAGGSLFHAASFLLRNSSAFNWLKPYKKQKNYPAPLVNRVVLVTILRFISTCFRNLRKGNSGGINGLLDILRAMGQR